MRSIGPLLGGAWWLVGATAAWAHAVLTGSSLDGRSLAPNVEAPVVLRFNSAIELGLSRVTLVDAQGRERALDVQQPPPKPGHVAVTVPALEPGSYGLRYKIFAVDGHVTENVLRFTVAAPR
jgi:copper resistance protein C